jgi:hypothetical protein
MNPYLARLRNFNSEKGDTSATAKTDKTHPATGFGSFGSSSGSPFSEIGAPGRKPPSRLDPVSRPTVPTTYARMFTALHARCPTGVNHPRWCIARQDADSFMLVWGRQAAALGWQPDDLFGLDSRAPLVRHDAMGLVWSLQGNPVIALTPDAAAIRIRVTAILKFYRRGADHSWARRA